MNCKDLDTVAEGIEGERLPAALDPKSKKSMRRT
jgi:hypothetical protein